MADYLYAVGLAGEIKFYQYFDFERDVELDSDGSVV